MYYINFYLVVENSDYVTTNFNTQNKASLQERAV